MRPFAYVRADDAAGAVATVAADPEAGFLGAGTNLVDHLKLDVERPGLLVDVSRLPLDAVEDVEGGGLRVGATVRNSALAADRRVRHDYPVLSQALLAGATGQLRNMATTAGNLLQRTRCVYFRDVTTPCAKREPGSGCSAIGGYTRYHAVLGASSHCIATHPSDMAVGMAVLDPVVVVLGPGGEKRIPFAELHRLPGDSPERDTVLEHGDLITHVEVPAYPAARNSAYRKVRDRASYAFALVSVAAVLEVTDGRVADVRLAFGGVAHRPWRALAAEELLRGQPATEETFRAAADAELAAAEPQPGNAFKVPMLRGAVVAVLRDLTTAAARAAGTGEDR
ncbi:FAD binding domain-containing protein [Kineococcus rubinsiae]|uniref:FAD binding domain-containing protein n=1 Tax=Kineococcus rubinsiae TaxID=2609562 RepID=UPI00142FEA30|nr:xanthine dehydrogenase family protein subunit M [Kineococcus rubinsiae]NIZ93758.1 xanthine dehydrogenase family protein subunit M [Kineococcus rubinsiae]